MKVGKKKVREKAHFRFSFVVLFFAASFLCCFTLYMKEIQPTSYYKSGGEIISAAAEEEVTVSAPASRRTLRYLNGCIFVGGDTAAGLVSYGYIPDSNRFADTADRQGILAALDGDYITGLYLMPEISFAENFDSEMLFYSLLADDAKDSGKDIYLLSMPPSADKDETEKRDVINVSLKFFAEENELVYLDIATGLKDNEGVLPEVYSSENGMEREAYGLIISYILSHAK